MTTLLQDVRYAARLLGKSPGFTAVALVTLALGIGANAAIFSVVNGILLEPLDYLQPGRVVKLQTSWAGEPDAGISPAEYYDYRDEIDVFAALGVYAFSSPALTGGDRPERLRGAFVSAGVFPAFGVPALHGRVFTADEELPGHDVAILGFDLWQRRFGGAEDVVGTSVVLDGRARTVIGIMPPGFRMPEDYTSGERTQVWLPLGIDRTTVTNRGSHFLQGVARPDEGVTAERTSAAVTALARRMVERFPDDYPADMRFTASAIPLVEDVIGSVRPVLFVLLTAVGLVLLAACVNVANLVLARSDARQGEFALRAALGAGRARLVRQLVVESLVLAAAGGVLGLLLAAGAVKLLAVLQPPDLPRLDAVTLDLRVVAFTLAAIGLTGMLLGVVPALQATGTRFAAALHEAGVRSIGGRQRLRGGLVVGEMAVALVLLIGAVLLVRSFAELRGVDPGYRIERVLTAEVRLPTATYAGQPEVTGFFHQLLEQIAALPGVEAAGAVSNLPLATDLGDLNFDIEGRETPSSEVSPKADWQTVTPGYFRAMDIALVRGRGIEASDDARAPGVVVINETAATRYWPGENPIGARFRLGGGAAPGWVTIVGIARDVRHAAFDEPARSQMYLPHAQFRFWNDGGPVRGLTLAVRTDGEPETLAKAVRAELASLDPTLPISTFRSMEEVVSAAIARPRLMMLLMSIFAGVALVLGAVGVYGVMAQLVNRRRREMGIRLALGARAAQIAGLVLKRSLVLTASGIAIGVLASLAATRALSGMLFGVTPLDTVTFVAAPLVLVAVAMLAAWVPIRRATCVDPNLVLRHE